MVESSMQRSVVSSLLRYSRVRMASSSTSSSTPMEDLIRSKVNEALKPEYLDIRNDSSKHSYHRAMVGNVSSETHFAVSVVSDAFKSKMQPARHRMVYALLQEEMAREGGIHALQLSTKTPEEARKLKARQAENDTGRA